MFVSSIKPKYIKMKKIHRAVFKLLASKGKIKLLKTTYSVVMATNCDNTGI